MEKGSRSKCNVYDDTMCYTPEERKTYLNMLANNSYDTGLNILDDKFWICGDDAVEYIEYPEKRDPCVSTVKVATIAEVAPAKAYVDDDGIYVPSRYDYRCHELLISRELFVEAYNKWIKNNTSRNESNDDDADCWCE